MEYTENTMETYIRKEKSACLEVLGNRKKNMSEYIDVIKSKKNIKRILFLATGSSANAVHSAKYYLEELLNVDVEVKIPLLFSNYQRVYDENAFVIGVSQSGKSYSTIEAIKTARQLGYKDTMVLTADRNSAIVKEAQYVVDIGCGKETVGYVTMGFTSTVLTIMLMAVEGAFIQGKIDESTYCSEIKKLENAVDKIDDIIEKSNRWYEVNRTELAKGQRFVTIAYGACVGTAMESCTKITETVRCPISAHELEEYMHGPYLELNENHFIFFLQQEGKLKKRMEALSDYVRNTTEHCFTLTDEKESDDKRTLPMGIKIEENISPLLYVLPFQILSFRLSKEKGIDLRIDRFSDFDKVLKSKI